MKREEKKLESRWKNRVDSRASIQRRDQDWGRRQVKRKEGCCGGQEDFRI